MDQNVILVLMRLDLNDQANPLRAGAGPRGDEAQLLEKGKRYFLLAGVLDPGQASKSVPITGIPLVEDKLDAYNAILEGFQKVSELFYGDNGFVKGPQTYNNIQQDRVSSQIANIGRQIYELFPDGNPVRIWLANLLRGPIRPAPVTIITNDFGIPWFWLKREQFSGRYLCEACSLGMLQLSAVGRPGENMNQQGGNSDRAYEALLIKGSNLALLDEEFSAIESLLEAPRPKERAYRCLKVQHASTSVDIRDIVWRYQEDGRLRDCCIVHFSGRFSSKHLFLNDRALPDESLLQVLNGSLLVLDGFSEDNGLGAWADVEELTSILINKGALGCIASVLPVKYDPIASKILWDTFYIHLKRGRTTVGQALVEARLALKDHFDKIDSKNPAWLFYQLIGSAAVQLYDEGESQDG